LKSSITDASSHILGNQQQLFNQAPDHATKLMSSLKYNVLKIFHLTKSGSTRIWSRSGHSIGNYKGPEIDLVKEGTQPAAEATQPSPQPCYKMDIVFLIQTSKE
jgi:hypothetical protein